MNCPVGRADADGILETIVPCGIGKLNVYKRGFDIYDEMHSSDGLVDASVTLTKTPIINLHFYEVVIDEVEAISEYRIKEGAISPIDNGLRDGAVMMTVFEPASYELHEFLFTENTGRLVGVPAGTQAFDMALYESIETPTSSVNGLMGSTYDVRENLDGKDLYIYIPYYPGIADSGTDTEIATEAAKLSNLLRKCGIGPITDTEVDEDTTCTMSYSDVLVIE